MLTGLLNGFVFVLVNGLVVFSSWRLANYLLENMQLLSLHEPVLWPHQASGVASESLHHAPFFMILINRNTIYITRHAQHPIVSCVIFSVNTVAGLARATKTDYS